jgi:hypothetical protein
MNPQLYTLIQPKPRAPHQEQLQLPSYPKQISHEKFPVALKLYTNFRLARPDEELHSATDGAQAPASSRASASLISFARCGSPTSAAPNGSTELISFTGKRVKQCVRRRLSPRSKAKANLIRCLGPCRSCSSRKVPVVFFVPTENEPFRLICMTVSLRSPRH